MNSTSQTPEQQRRANFFAVAFVRVGILPILMVLAIVIFSMMSDNFLTVSNLHSALRQNSFIIIVTLAQFLVLLSGGFDLSVGSITALVSVSSAMTMASAAGSFSPGVVIALGSAVGIGVGLMCGFLNALGISFGKINPFIMTLASASVFQGIALMLTSGVPVYGLPTEFSQWFGFKLILGIGVPIWIAFIVAIILAFLMSRTKSGRHIYAVGSNSAAARLSGVNINKTLIIAYSSAGALSALGALLLTARIETGEANIGASLPLETIAAAVIGGVSLKGGIGRVWNAVLGAIFIGLIVNGMNLAKITSYWQMIILGLALAIAVIAERAQQRVGASIYLVRSTK